MSRIDEAMRRAAAADAAAQAPSSQALEDLVAVSAGSDADALAQEPFPLELQDRRRRIPATTEQAKTSGGSYETSDPHQAPPSESSLFDRIDSRLTEKI